MLAMIGGSQLGWMHCALVCLLPVICSAQFGGMGGSDYSPPAPICKPFTCPKGQKPAGNGDHKLWSYGCKDSGMNILSMADMNNPLGGLNKGKNVDKCCVERDICKQTCGTTSQECHNAFQACSKKTCKGDQNCNLAAMMSDIRSEPEDLPEEPIKPYDAKNPPDYEADKKKRDCRGYEHFQKSACVCVPDEDWQLTTDANLKNFYRTHNPEKLDDAGEIKDIDEVWKKWKGKEPQMFQALAAKYKAKAVTMKEKPKPAPYKPPPPLSKEQAKEDKRMEENRKKWKLEDEQRDREKAEREQRKAEEKEAEAEARREESEGETVEL